MKTVHKYLLPPCTLGEGSNVNMPEGAQILTVSIKDRSAFIWALVETDNPVDIRFFRVYATGQEIAKQETIKYIGTLFPHDGVYTYHVFEATQ